MDSRIREALEEIKDTADDGLIPLGGMHASLNKIANLARLALSSPAEEAQDGISTNLLAEMIFGMVIHGIGTKRQIIDRIAGEIDNHRPRSCKE